ncbi:MAG: cytochrome c3 family protein [Deltaproteobacteria bacterium]|nr:cytochrome c3 family protein [Deltaproteobacteria bacterium]
MNGNQATANKNLRGLLVAGGTVAMLLVAPGTLFAAGESRTGQMPEKTDINIQASCPQITDAGPDSKEVKGFSHKFHAEKYLPGKSGFSANPYPDAFTCGACHAGATSREEITAADQCRRLAAALKASGTGKDYRQIMHATCQECHKNMEKAGETSGPVKCNECHGK